MARPTAQSDYNDSTVDAHNEKWARYITERQQNGESFEQAKAEADAAIGPWQQPSWWDNPDVAARRYESLPVQIRVHDREWWNYFQLLEQAGYKSDEAIHEATARYGEPSWEWPTGYFRSR